MKVLYLLLLSNFLFAFDVNSKYLVINQFDKSLLADVDEYLESNFDNTFINIDSTMDMIFDSLDQDNNPAALYMDDIKISSNRSFGIVFFIVFLIIALYPILNQENIRIWSLSVSIVFLILGLINSFVLTPLNKLWFKFGILLGKVVSPLVMGLIFFFVVTPIALIMRMLKKDILNLKLSEKNSYWIEKNEPKSKMKNQF